MLMICALYNVADTVISTVLGFVIVVLVVAIITISVVFIRKTTLWSVYFLVC